MNPYRDDPLYRELHAEVQGRLRVEESVLPTPCWIWTGAVTRGGYGKISRNRKHLLVHRWVYELAIGPIPEGLHLDHLCSVRPCVNPAHLEPVTPAENFNRCRDVHAAAVAKLRKTHCKRGHEFTPENTITDSRGSGRGRKCRECHRAINLASWYRRREARSSG